MGNKKEVEEEITFLKEANLSDLCIKRKILNDTFS